MYSCVYVYVCGLCVCSGKCKGAAGGLLVEALDCGS